MLVVAGLDDGSDLVPGWNVDFAWHSLKDHVPSKEFSRPIFQFGPRHDQLSFLVILFGGSRLPTRDRGEHTEVDALGLVAQIVELVPKVSQLSVGGGSGPLLVRAVWSSAS